MSFARLTPLVTAASFALVSMAQAHPGHDGHEGGEFSWDWDHLVANPVATLVWLTIAGLAVWALRRTWRARANRDRSSR
ncbi:MAG TPA: hypothetical protein VHF69_08125 [Candidatus Synoicihabitans sp.]|nr:hypothetical protein [Candidatus Synoicihabitans sp.]